MASTSTAKRRSTARTSRAASKAASFSVDQVYELLKAVNEQTLKRMENEIVYGIGDQINNVLDTLNFEDDAAECQLDRVTAVLAL
jgi:hypothetical protein